MFVYKYFKINLKTDKQTNKKEEEEEEEVIIVWKIAIFIVVVFRNGACFFKCLQVFRIGYDKISVIFQ